VIYVIIKKKEPAKDEVEELIEGVKKNGKNYFLNLFKYLKTHHSIAYIWLHFVSPILLHNIRYTPTLCKNSPHSFSPMGVVSRQLFGGVWCN